MRNLLRTGLVLAAVLVLFPASGARAAEGESAPTVSLDSFPGDRVELRLAASRALAGVQVRVEESEVTPGVVTLVGSVRDAGQEQRALRIARKTRGVSTAHSELEVDPALPVATSRSDAEIVRDVAVRLANDSVLGGKASESWMFGWQIEGAEWKVEVDVDDGDVSLSGTVLLPQRAIDAVRAARLAPGVRSVRTDLQLRSADESGWNHFP